MQQDMEKAYRESVDFWDRTYNMSDEEKEAALREGTGEDDWKALAPSKKILKFISLISECDHFLDYGCGYGWASICAAKAGCKKVTAVDVVQNAVDLSRFYTKLFGLEDVIHSELVDYEWLSKQPEGVYDGFFCGNVLDVVPMEAARDILESASRVLKKGAKLIVTMNYYTEPKDDPKRNITAKDGRYLFVDGILRMMCLTDEEWTKLLGEYFVVEGLDHFAWPGEEKETRRLFSLRKK